MAKKPKYPEFIEKIKSKLKNIYVFNTTASVYLFLKILYKKLVTFDLDQRAAAVSYSFMLAVFPGTIFLFTLIPYIPINNLDISILEFLKSVMPDAIYNNVKTTIVDIVSRPRFDILSFGFVFTYFAATNGMMSLMRSFNMALHQKEKRSFFKARAIAILLTSLLVFILILGIVVLIVGKLFLVYLEQNNILSDKLNYFNLHFLGYGSMFLIFFVGISCIYYFAPAIHEKLNFFNFGAAFAAATCIIATNIFSYYLENFNSYNRLYGSIGTVIGVMVWIYLIALILILGFELNISLRSAVNTSEKK